MEALQLAQMLADLNDLQAAQDQSAAKSLVCANKTLDPQDGTKTEAFRKQSPAEGRVATPSAVSRMTDKYGRRMFTPPLSRTSSATPASIPGTPRGEHTTESDVDKASNLMSLYEIRARLKEQDSSGLAKAREKINALAAKQHKHNMAASSQGKSALAQQRDRSDSPRMRYPG
ncbi:hypothetical protein GGR50DRAFT_678017 [Xylaria sp. CBS 124048]|nr:hypothetical protein GGR50DRAFT_678017 [Xylaria sp. CBS 124048]